jgi:antitoxin CptB
MPMSDGLQTQPTALLDERGVSKLIWRCRRGLLENDLFIERFFARYQGQITHQQADGLLTLMDLADNDLLDLLLKRKEPDAELASPAVLLVLSQLRTGHQAKIEAAHHT